MANIQVNALPLGVPNSTTNFNAQQSAGGPGSAQRITSAGIATYVGSLNLSNLADTQTSRENLQLGETDDVEFERLHLGMPSSLSVGKFVVGTSTAETEDQDTVGGGGVVDANGAAVIWQSFTAGIAGVVSKVEWSFQSLESDNYRISFYNGVGTGGALITQFDTALSVPSGPNQFVTLEFPTAPEVSATAQYTVAITKVVPNGTTAAYVQQEGLNPYEGGRNNNGPDFDYRIVTYVTPVTNYFKIANIGDITVGTQITFYSNANFVAGSNAISLGGTNPTCNIGNNGKLGYASAGATFFSNAAAGDVCLQQTDISKRLRIGVGTASSQLDISDTEVTANVNIACAGNISASSGNIIGTWNALLHTGQFQSAAIGANRMAYTNGSNNIIGSANYTVNGSGSMTITGTLTSAGAAFSGTVTGVGMAGDVTGNNGATVVATVGGSTAALINSAELLANAATNNSTANAIVRRNASSAFSAGGANFAAGSSTFVISGTNPACNVGTGFQFGSVSTVNSFFSGTAINDACVRQTNSTLGLFLGVNNGTAQLIIRNTQGAFTVPLLIGTQTADASALLTMVSTTQGLLPPRMTTTQKNNIASPTSGLLVYDTTLGKLCVRGASAWETITST